MSKSVIHTLVICLFSLMLGACINNQQAPHYAPGTESVLQHGKELFDQDHYKQAMHDLLPLACDCIPEAEYAVGYMYYYGYGVAQDTEMGRFWIKRSASRGYKPAQDALQTMASEKYTYKRSKRHPRGI
jgi:TPR repeat protein